MSEKTVVLVTMAGVFSLMILLMGFITAVLFYYQKKRKTFISQLEDVKSKYEQEILRVQLEVQEQTLLHVSREIHDNIGQSISLAKLYMTTVPVDAGSRTAEMVNNTEQLLGKTMEDLRDLCKNLTLDEIKSEGLGKAIESQVNQLTKTESYSVIFEIRGNYRHLDDQQEIVLFRIFQESINNIIRHAKAREIQIILDYRPHELFLEIRDDGTGFAAPLAGKGSKPLTGGRGLNNMKARAELIQAQLTIKSHPGLGSIVSLIAPTPIKISHT
ncbi:MAG TPA: sensor histidine kinase [Puia sp.]|uniref:sensor histidine kinase n=1 Tax=Puia sp. TaxID=2045100 RepID=UPI002C9305E0|nr:sensor histidine kinase [Puia sp.]HVU97756.1 sensor histidine kinase [Puia sp.]